MGKQRSTRQPNGTLRARQWAALTRLYVAAADGNDGIDGETLLSSKHGFDWWATLRRLEEYQPHALIERRQRYQDGRAVYRYCIMTPGRAYYEREWARYCALYPNVDAPEPEEQPT